MGNTTPVWHSQVCGLSAVRSARGAESKNVHGEGILGSPGAPRCRAGVIKVDACRDHLPEKFQGGMLLLGGESKRLPRRGL